MATRFLLVLVVGLLLTASAVHGQPEPPAAPPGWQDAQFQVQPAQQQTGFTFEAHGELSDFQAPDGSFMAHYQAVDGPASATFVHLFEMFWPSIVPDSTELWVWYDQRIFWPDVPRDDKCRCRVWILSLVDTEVWHILDLPDGDSEGMFHFRIPLPREIDSGERVTMVFDVFQKQTGLPCPIVVLSDHLYMALGMVPTPSEPLPEITEASLTTYPNPVRDEATALLTLEETEYVRVSVYDALGREVHVISEGLKPQGEHTLALEAHGLPAGVYVVRAVGETFVATTKVTITH